MNFDEYQTASARTMVPSKCVPVDYSLAGYALGLAGETGEVVEMIKKHIFHGRHMSLQDLKDECSDVLWYLSAILTSQGLSLDEVAEHNVAKLLRRYPDGFVQGGGVR